MSLACDNGSVHVLMRVFVLCGSAPVEKGVSCGDGSVLVDLGVTEVFLWRERELSLC